MKIISTTRKIGTDTFEPILELTIELPLEAIADTSNRFGRETLANILGTALLDAFDDYDRQL